MKNKTIKLIGLGLAAVLVLTSIAVFADGDFRIGRREGAGMEMRNIAGKGILAKFKEILDKQVADGKITKEQAEGIYAECETCDLARLERKELTEEEIASMKAERLAELKEILDKQVADGKITQEQADERYARCESNDFKGVGMQKRMNGRGRMQDISQ